MDGDSLKSLLVSAFKNRRQVLVKGKPGCGKTFIVKESADTAGMDMILTHPAISDPTDYKGFPVKAEDHATFLPFGDIWKAIKSEKPTVFFVDDLGQSSDTVMKALMQLIHGRRLNGNTLPDHVVFCGATNDVGHKAGVTGILEPVKSRFHTIVELESSLDSWCGWALKRVPGIPFELIAYLRTNPKALNEFAPTKELTNTPCERNWEHFADWLNDGLSLKKDFEVFAGCVGKGRATEYSAFEDLAKNAPSIDAILMNPDTEPVPDDSHPAIRYLVATGLAARAKKQNMGKVMRYLNRMPQPFRVLCIRDAHARDRDIAKTAEVVAWSLDEGKDFI
jgi:hypothetical protein